MNISAEDTAFICARIKAAEKIINNDDVDSLLELLDEFMAINGFDKNYDLTDEGRTAQRIYDRIYFNN